MKKRRIRPGRLIVEALSVLAGLIMLVPVYIVLVNAFKPYKEILTRTFRLPQSFYTENLTYVWTQMNYGRILLNTIFCVVAVVCLAVVLSAMCGYKLSRANDKRSKWILNLLLVSMIIPFQSIMLPVYKIAYKMGFGDSLIGYVIVQVPLYAHFALFVYHGFIKSIPVALEESAIIDGCGPFRVFFSIVFPLMKTSTASIVVLFALWVWNDYTFPSLILRSNNMRTLTSAVYAFFSSYYTRWDYGLASLTLAILPITLFFVFMQRYFISGIVSGAVKG